MKGTWDSFTQLLVANSFLSHTCGWLLYAEIPSPDLRQMGRLVGEVTDFGEGFQDKPGGPPATWRAVMEPHTHRMVLLLVRPPQQTSRSGHFTFLAL